jgi:hypothetical protein
MIERTFGQSGNEFETRFGKLRIDTYTLNRIIQMNLSCLLLNVHDLHLLQLAHSNHGQQERKDGSKRRRSMRATDEAKGWEKESMSKNVRGRKTKA